MMQFNLQSVDSAIQLLPQVQENGVDPRSARFNYRPWGETDIVHDDDGSGVANPIRFTGREMDETGLYYYRARYYSPQMGRFISKTLLRESNEKDI